ncbi:hypothetical protein CBM2633_B10683 [Cupriavidus taiwanensis]|nr:hypothetical protein CBM2633_B10683 [Cupriavidus taiwanensis]
MVAFAAQDGLFARQLELTRNADRLVAAIAEQSYMANLVSLSHP